jgi:hypothetical protein
MAYQLPHCVSASKDERTNSGEGDLCQRPKRTSTGGADATPLVKRDIIKSAGVSK